MINKDDRVKFKFYHYGLFFGTVASVSFKRWPKQLTKIKLEASLKGGRDFRAANMLILPHDAKTLVGPFGKIEKLKG